MKGVQLFLKRNSPTILSCVGALGVVGTSALAVKATPKALELVDGEDLSPIEIIKRCWKCYIPAAVTGLSTIFCIFGANVLNQKQQAAITSAYMLLNNTYKEYRNKIKDEFGNTDNLARQSIVRDKYDGSTRGDECLFYEYNYGEFFERSKEEVLNAEHQFNLKLASEGYACLNDFYELLGLPTIQVGDVLYWSSDEFHGDTWVDFTHELIDLEDGMESYIIDITTPPTI